jgi:hypothetical protein
VAQVGRISGPLLEANLLRQGIANGTQANLSFKNNAGDQSLLKIDVTNGRIGVDVEAPANEIQVSQTTQTVDLIGDTAGVANYTISNNNINADSGSIYLDAGEHIQLTNLETEQFYISDNYISTHNTNTNIDFTTNGTGTVEVQSNLNVYGSLHSTNNITLDGNIIFGDTGDDSTALTDTVTFDADINSDIIPDATDTYTLGSIQKNWDNIDTKLVNGQLLSVGIVSVGGIDLTARPGNILYVAKDGANTNVGDHINGALLTIEEALSRADASTDGPVTIKIMPGVYEENLPLVVPNRVSIMGDEIRSVTVKPAAGSESKDVFHLDDSTMISKLTIKDYQYNSGNNTGYAFRFAPNAVITNRSPYIQDVTIITSGTVTSASDPRGFAQGDAGKGAWIDGAELNSASVEASMLFHSATFITPGVDAITMTNGVRVEWLNSFSYFANRGLYAVRGSTGRTSYDGSTVNYGAEVRSIGSANVYGSYGAVADGADTLMYLIQHNFGYIGAGKFADNDDSRAIQSQEVTELNSGKINFVTTDHTGGFRIGDNFFVDFETGNTTINIDTLSVNQFNALRVNTGASTTTIDGAFIETGNLIIANNLIQTDTGDLNLASSTGTINLQDNTNITGTLDISGDFSFDGALNIGGDQATDSLTFNAALDQDFNPNQHQKFALGSFAKKWLIAHLDKLETPDIDVYDNVIETTTSNADLELRANGTGKIRITDSARFTNNLTINGTTNILDDLSITDSVLPIVGDVNQTGNFTISEDADIDQNINVGASAQFEEILVDDNFITTTTSNTALELRTSGTGTVNLQDTVNVANNLTAGDTTATNANITLNVTTDNANIGNVEINDNNISATSTDSNLILNADDEVRVTGTDVVFGQDLTVAGLSVIASTNITGTLNHTGDRTTFVGNSLTLNGELTVDNVYIEDNFITTTTGNLLLGATGNVVADTNNVSITNDLTVSGVTTLDDTTINSTLTHVGDNVQTGNLAIGGSLDIDSINIDTNVITTSAVDTDLDLRSTNRIYVPTANVEVTNNTTVSGVTDLRTTSLSGGLTHVGTRTITNEETRLKGFIYERNVNHWRNVGAIDGNSFAVYNGITYNAGGNVPQITIGGATYIQGALVDVDGSDFYFTIQKSGDTEVVSIPSQYTQVGNLDVTGQVDFQGDVQLTDVNISDNVITTTIGNNNLDLRASGTGEVLIDGTNMRVTQDLFAASIATNDISINQSLVLDELVITDSNIEINENYISTKVSNSDLQLRATGDVTVASNNVILSQNLTVNGTTALANTNITGTLTHVGDRIQTGDYNLTGNLNISSLATDRAFQFDDVKIEGNVLQTTLSNSNLDLRAAGTGEILFNEDLHIDKNLNIGSFNVDAVAVDDNVSLEVIELSTDVQFFDNVITTTNSNSDLELRTNGTGSVYLQELGILDNNISTVNSAITFAPTENLNITSTTALLIPRGTSAQRILDTGSILDGGSADNNSSILSSGTASTVFDSESTIYDSGASIIADQGTPGAIRFNTDDNLFEGTTQNTVTFNGVYSSDRLTSVLAHPTNDTILFTANSVSSGVIDSTGITLNGLQVDDVFINDSTITTNVSNSDLELARNGSGEVILNNISIVGNTIKNNTNKGVVNLASSGFGYTKFTGTSGVVIPFGGTATQPDPATNPIPVGDTRYNTDTQILETWDGNTYLTSMGPNPPITPTEFNDLLLEYTIIFG